MSIFRNLGSLSSFFRVSSLLKQKANSTQVKRCSSDIDSIAKSFPTLGAFTFFGLVATVVEYPGYILIVHHVSDSAKKEKIKSGEMKSSCCVISPKMANLIELIRDEFRSLSLLFTLELNEFLFNPERNDVLMSRLLLLPALDLVLQSKFSKGQSTPSSVLDSVREAWIVCTASSSNMCLYESHLFTFDREVQKLVKVTCCCDFETGETSHQSPRLFHYGSTYVLCVSRHFERVKLFVWCRNQLIFQIDFRENERSSFVRDSLFFRLFSLSKSKSQENVKKKGQWSGGVFLSSQTKKHPKEHSKEHSEKKLQKEETQKMISKDKEKRSIGLITTAGRSNVREKKEPRREEGRKDVGGRDCEDEKRKVGGQNRQDRGEEKGGEEGEKEKKQGIEQRKEKEPKRKQEKETEKERELGMDEGTEVQGENETKREEKEQKGQKREKTIEIPALLPSDTAEPERLEWAHVDWQQKLGTSFFRNSMLVTETFLFNSNTKKWRLIQEEANWVLPFGKTKQIVSRMLEWKSGALTVHTRGLKSEPKEPVEFQVFSLPKWVALRKSVASFQSRLNPWVDDDEIKHCLLRPLRPIGYWVHSLRLEEVAEKTLVIKTCYKKHVPKRTAHFELVYTEAQTMLSERYLAVCQTKNQVIYRDVSQGKEWTFSAREQEKVEQEELQQDKLQQEKLQQEKLQQEKLQQDKFQQEKLQQEKLQQEKLQQEELQQERLQQEILQEAKNARKPEPDFQDKTKEMKETKRESDDREKLGFAKNEKTKAKKYLFEFYELFRC